jgi:membrane-bound lytic murein transglycosylase B
MAPSQAFAQTEPFSQWLQGVAGEAVSRGVSPQTVQQALAGVSLDDRVIALDRKQPEKSISFRAYVKNVLNHSRINKGRLLMRCHRHALEEIANRYGVSPSIIVALWGVESGFGANMGGFNVIDSLATLAYEGRRASFFRKELLHVLHLMDEEGLDRSELLGSWAGAMGQNQFMPSTFRNFAVDHDGDGRRDIWESEDDVFASIANYLAAEGWQKGLRWGREVKLTKPVPENQTGPDKKHPLAYWRRIGVRDMNRKPLPRANITASLVQPDGAGGRSFLVYDNFRALMRWNRSTYFAVSVGLLADRLN